MKAKNNEHGCWPMCRECKCKQARKDYLLKKAATEGRAKMYAVYRYLDRDGRVLYVGFTSRGPARLLEHARQSAWFSLALTCTLEHFDDRNDALRRERELIEELRPPHNVLHKKRAPQIGAQRIQGAA